MPRTNGHDYSCSCNECGSWDREEREDKHRAKIEKEARFEEFRRRRNDRQSDTTDVVQTPPGPIEQFFDECFSFLFKCFGYVVASLITGFFCLLLIGLILRDLTSVAMSDNLAGATITVAAILLLTYFSRRFWRTSQSFRVLLVLTPIVIAAVLVLLFIGTNNRQVPSAIHPKPVRTGLARSTR
jgi:hypothetical protein